MGEVSLLWPTVAVDHGAVYGAEGLLLRLRQSIVSSDRGFDSGLVRALLTVCIHSSGTL
jgi:hypothetical protein